jgi:hypothetical protein
MIYYVLPLLLCAGILIAGCSDRPREQAGCPVDAAYRVRRAAYWCACVAMMLLAGMRWETGTDWAPYAEQYADPASRVDFESGYVALVSAFSSWTQHYTVFLLFSSAVSVGMIGYVCYRVLGPSLPALLIFYSYYYLGSFLGAQRRQFSIALCMLSIVWIIERRPIRFVVCVGLASLFHSSSLIFLPAYVIYGLRPAFAKAALVACGVGCVGLYLVGLDRLLLPILGTADFGLSGVKLFDYASDPRAYEVAGGAGVAVGLLKRSVVLVLAALTPPEESRSRMRNGLLRVYVASVLLYVLFMATIPMLSVLTIFFAITEVLLIPLLIARSQAPRGLVALALLCFAAFQVTSILAPYWDLYVPYYAFFEGAARANLY